MNLQELKQWLQKKQEYYEEYQGLDYLCCNKEKEIKIQEVIDKINEMLGE